MSKQKMQQARELIKSKQYDEARAILETVDHPKATEWLEKLGGLAPKPDTPPLPKEDAAIKTKPEKSTPSSSIPQVWLYAALAIALVIIVTVAAIMLTSSSGDGELEGKWKPSGEDIALIEFTDDEMIISAGEDGFSFEVTFGYRIEGNKIHMSLEELGDSVGTVKWISDDKVQIIDDETGEILELVRIK